MGGQSSRPSSSGAGGADTSTSMHLWGILPRQMGAILRRGQAIVRFVQLRGRISAGAVRVPARIFQQGGGLHPGLFHLSDVLLGLLCGIDFLPWPNKILLLV